MEKPNDNLRTLEMELKIRAIQFAVDYCKTSSGDDLLKVAQQIFDFISPKFNEEE